MGIDMGDGLEPLKKRKETKLPAPEFAIAEPLATAVAAPKPEEAKRVALPAKKAEGGPSVLEKIVEFISPVTLAEAAPPCPLCPPRPSADFTPAQQKPQLPRMREETEFKRTEEQQTVPLPLSGYYVFSFYNEYYQNALAGDPGLADEFLGNLRTGMVSIYDASQRGVGADPEAVWSVFGNPDNPGWLNSEGKPAIFDAGLFTPGTPECVLKPGVTLDQITDGLISGELTLADLLFERRNEFFDTDPNSYAAAFLASFVLETMFLSRDPHIKATTAWELGVGITWRSAKTAELAADSYSRRGRLPTWVPSIYEIGIKETVRSNESKGVIEEHGFTVIETGEPGQEVEEFSRTYSVKGRKITTETTVSASLLAGPTLNEFIFGVGSLRLTDIEVADQDQFKYRFSLIQDQSRNFRWQGMNITLLRYPWVGLGSGVAAYVSTIGVQSKTGESILKKDEPVFFVSTGVSAALGRGMTNKVLNLQWTPSLFREQGEWHAAHYATVNYSGFGASGVPITLSTFGVSFSFIPGLDAKPGAGYTTSRLAPGYMVGVFTEQEFKKNQFPLMPTAIKLRGSMAVSGSPYYEGYIEFIFEK